MSNKLPGLHRKFEIGRSLFSPSSSGRNLRKLIEGLLNLCHVKFFIVDFFPNTKPTATDLHQINIRSRIEEKI